MPKEQAKTPTTPESNTAQETLKKEFGLEYPYLIERGYHKHIVEAMKAYARQEVIKDRGRLIKELPPGVNLDIVRNLHIELK